jgi:hypothetical protein
MAKSGEVDRTINLKLIRYVPGKGAKFTPIPYQEVLADFGRKTALVKDRLLGNPSAGTLVAFIDQLQPVFNAKAFRLNSYTPGDASTGFVPDLTVTNVDVRAFRVRDSEDRIIELLNTVHVLALGECLLIESAPNGGGATLVARYLNQVVRRVVAKTTPAGPGMSIPYLQLVDVASRGLRDEIRRGGGVKKLTLGLREQIDEAQDGTFGEVLTHTLGHVHGTKEVTVSWNAVDTLPEQQVIDAFQEAQDDEDLSKIVIELKHGGRITGLEQYKLNRRVSVPAIGGRTAQMPSMVGEMKSFMAELMTEEGGYSVLTPEGMVAMRSSAAEQAAGGQG